ncbi:hypothetical protein VaNZ11_007140 [Volvox africanus]|uniref:Uncharacterized protein n=1 Tax=Volvox africanus TaxID=51714 RepID=A0ABQ5S243_9CHLO|nr:hypothetical protein VaNZ11_007140 [Volvox africanus]
MDLDALQARPNLLRVFFNNESKATVPSLPTLKAPQEAKIGGRRYDQNTDEDDGSKILQSNSYSSRGVCSSTGASGSDDARASDINGVIGRNSACSSDGAISNDRTGDGTQTPRRLVRLKCWDELLRSEAEEWEWRYKAGSPRMLIRPREVMPSPKQATVASSPEATWHRVQLRHVEGLPGPLPRYG